ncbi:hypothetical protein ACFY4C_41940 [Actinomadura viridis]|uniref:hypothetical protein n=1 Tax=Actinomadura viridis TaxID=58110 RepID=UPI003686FFF5
MKGNVVIWSIVVGPSPDARAVEAARAGVTIPDDVLAWAESHGVALHNPDAYLLVTPKEEAGPVDGETAYCEGAVSAEDMEAIWAALTPEHAPSSPDS